jgi:cell division protein FtsW
MGRKGTKKKYPKKKIDYPIFIITLTLVCIGVVMVFSASYYYANQKFGDSYHFFKRQGMWAIVGLCGMIFMANFDYWKLKKFSKPLLLISIAMLVAVLLIGDEKNNATRWLSIGKLSVQPSEVAKLSLIVYMSESMSRRQKKLKSFWQGIVPYLLVTGVFFVLIIKQPNLSTAGTLVILTFIMMFVAGCSMKHLWGLVGLGALGAAALILRPGDKEGGRYWYKRYIAFKDPWVDPNGKGYQIIQSLYSLGSGGWFGMGLGESRQKYLYLPYSETDFIFAVIGEELGFIGATIIMLLFLILIWRGVRVAISAPDLFGSLLATGIISMIAIQVSINIAVVTKSMPPTGVPLPFISYGGSSLFLFMSSIGVLLNISKYIKAN